MSIYNQKRSCPICEKEYVYPFQREEFFEHVEHCCELMSDEEFNALADKICYDAELT